MKEADYAGKKVYRGKTYIDRRTRNTEKDGQTQDKEYIESKGIVRVFKDMKKKSMLDKNKGEVKDSKNCGNIKKSGNCGKIMLKKVERAGKGEEERRGRKKFWKQ